jgi:hypothetical protein
MSCNDIMQKCEILKADIVIARIAVECRLSFWGSPACYVLGLAIVVGILKGLCCCD